MVDKFDPHLSCNNIKQASDMSDYKSKEISIESDRRKTILIETPTKTIDTNGIPAITEHKIKKPEFLQDKSVIIECPLYVSHPGTWAGIERIIESSENDISSFRRIIRYNSGIQKIDPDIIAPSVVFSKNPFRERVTSLGKKYKPCRE